MNKEQLQNKLKQLEEEMQNPAFWNNKVQAQEKLTEYNLIKQKIKDLENSGDIAILRILTGVGGDDAEDFSNMLFNMYQKFAEKMNWDFVLLDVSKSDFGIKSATVKITGKSAYQILQSEAGVHRLVRISPFNAQGKRQTSFSMVEVLPFIPKKEIQIKDDDLDVSFSRSGGKGGQNVNKVETAVKITHIPTGISVSCSQERTQQRNREIAMRILKSKLVELQEKLRKQKLDKESISKYTKNEWGNQIRSYILHPYKKVKDHKTNKESNNPEKILSGELCEIINC